MSLHIRYCRVCGKYTLREECCEKTILPRPPKYSPDDKYAKYRREIRAEELKKEGLI